MHHDFPNQYNKWCNKSTRSLDIIKPLDANKRYIKLLETSQSEPDQKSKKIKPESKSVDDYNKYVDELLKLTPHNQTYSVNSSLTYRNSIKSL